MDALRLLVGEAVMIDPLTAIESGVIVGAVIFVAWRLSPVQRSRRRRQDARARIVVRQTLHERAGVAGGRVPAAPADDRPRGAGVSR